MWSGCVVSVVSPNFNFLVVFNLPLNLVVTRGGCGAGAGARRGRCWVRIWWLYCSHWHHHVITAPARSKLPPPEIKLSVIIWFWFLFGGRAADICIHNIVIDGSRWTQRMPLSFVSSFMIGGLNRSLTGGTFLRKSLFKFYCQEIFLWRWAAGWPEHYLGRLFPWSTNENPVSRSRDHSWPIRGRLCPGLLIVPSSSSAIIQHLPIMSHFVILKQVLILLSTFHCNLSSAVSI